MGYRWPIRAHNDYLELALEAGVPGLVALALGVVVLTGMLRAFWREGATARGQALFGLAVLVLLALHSLVDYPLRSMAIASLACVAVAMLAPLGAHSSCATSDNCMLTNEGASS